MYPQSYTSKLSNRKIGVLNFNGFKAVTYIPQMKKVEVCLPKFDGEFYDLTIIYRDVYNYRVFREGRELKGMTLGVFNAKHIKMEILKHQNL